MTVTTTTNLDTYIAAAAQTIFSYTFQLFDAAHVKVFIDQVDTPAGHATDGWTIDTGAATITFDNGRTVGQQIIIQRVVPLDQQTNYTAYDAFPAETHETALDKGVMQTQQVSEEIGRSIKVALGDASGADFTLPPAQADRVIGVWDATAMAIVIGPDGNDIANAEGYANAASASAIAAAADAAQTNADVVTTNADVVTTNADVVITNADVVAANAAVATVNGYSTQASGTGPSFEFDGDQTQEIVALVHDPAPTLVNRAAGRSVTVVMTASGGTRTVTYNASWRQIGFVPSVIPIGKTLVLNFLALGAADTDVLVMGSVEA